MIGRARVRSRLGEVMPMTGRADRESARPGPSADLDPERPSPCRRLFRSLDRRRPGWLRPLPPRSRPPDPARRVRRPGAGRPELRAVRDEILGRERCEAPGAGRPAPGRGQGGRGGSGRPRTRPRPPRPTARRGSCSCPRSSRPSRRAPASRPGRRTGRPASRAEAIRLEAAKGPVRPGRRGREAAGRRSPWPTNASAASSTASPTTPRPAGSSGFVPHQGGWATPVRRQEARRRVRLRPDLRLGQGATGSRTSGAGELPDRASKRWLPAAEADALRRDWATRWEISTEHFRISTNVPLDEAISFGRKLEDLHQLFFALMADVIGPDRLPLAQRFREARPQADRRDDPRKPLPGLLLRDPRRIRPVPRPVPGRRGEGQPGDLRPAARSRRQFGGISYFFNDVGGQLDVTSTLYHEASHQLLFESAGPDDYARNVGPVLGLRRARHLLRDPPARARRHAPDRRAGRPPDRPGPASG